jgi:hypothetical protein
MGSRDEGVLLRADHTACSPSSCPEKTTRCLAVIHVLRERYRYGIPLLLAALMPEDRTIKDSEEVPCCADERRIENDAKSVVDTRRRYHRYRRRKTRDMNACGKHMSVMSVQMKILLMV